MNQKISNLNILKIIGIPDDNKAVIIHNDGMFRQFGLFFEGNSSFLEDTVIQNVSLSKLHKGSRTLFQHPQFITKEVCHEIHQ